MGRSQNPKRERSFVYDEETNTPPTPRSRRKKCADKQTFGSRSRAGTLCGRRRQICHLGRDPDPKRLKRALRYWKVGAKRKAKKKGA